MGFGLRDCWEIPAGFQDLGHRDSGLGPFMDLELAGVEWGGGLVSIGLKASRV